MRGFVFFLSGFIFLLSLTFITGATECSDAGGLCVTFTEDCPENYEESNLSCAPAVIPRCCISTEEVQVNECENAGYSCNFHGCPSQIREPVNELECPGIDYFCCKDKVYYGINQTMTIEPDVVKEGTSISVSVQLPTFRDCSHFITNPLKIEKAIGAGGCGPIGEAFGFSTIRLENLFGFPLEFGIYQIKIIAEKEGEENITLVGEFSLEGCRDSDEGKNYYKKGERISVEGIFEDACRISEAISAPHVEEGPYLLELFCGEGLEIGSELYECPHGCKDGTCVREPYEPPEGEECFSACPLDDKCYPFGYRKSGEYCSDNLEFVSQLEGSESCDNNFECVSNLCIDNSCVEAGLFRKIINWFKRVFG